MTTANLTAPLAAWDARSPAWVHQWCAKNEWARNHGIPVNETYRIEFYVIDAPFARVYTYATNEQGRRYIGPPHGEPGHDHDLCDAAVNPPFDQPLWELPPRELLESEQP